MGRDVVYTLIIPTPQRAPTHCQVHCDEQDASIDLCEPNET